MPRSMRTPPFKKRKIQSMGSAADSKVELDELKKEAALTGSLLFHDQVSFCTFSVPGSNKTVFVPIPS